MSWSPGNERKSDSASRTRRSPPAEYASDDEGLVEREDSDLVYRHAVVASRVTDVAAAPRSFKSAPPTGWEPEGDASTAWKSVTPASKLFQGYDSTYSDEYSSLQKGSRPSDEQGASPLDSSFEYARLTSKSLLPHEHEASIVREKDFEQFWSPFGSSCTSSMTSRSSSSSLFHAQVPYVTSDKSYPPGGGLHLETLPSTFRLERTNFTVKGKNASERMPLDTLLKSLSAAMEDAEIDVVDFRPAHTVYECSYQQGNRFISLWVRVFLPPDADSAQLFKLGEEGVTDEEKISYLVEAQLREGDRLHYSALYRDLLRSIEKQEDAIIGGTYRYHMREAPAMGEGLVLESVKLAPPRGGSALTRGDSASETKSGLDTSFEGFRGGDSGHDQATKELRTPELPASMMRTNEESEADMSDLITLAGMLRGRFWDVQADAAFAVAGLTADCHLLDVLSQAGAAGAATALCTASARLLVETHHRPALRQAAVAVSNLSSTAALRTALLASDPPASMGPSLGSQQRGLVDSLVAISMGTPREEATDGTKREEEIGARRACMAALANLALSDQARREPSMESLLMCEPGGRAAADRTLLRHLAQCRDTLRKHYAAP